jgi:hypothetical protein
MDMKESSKPKSCLRSAQEVKSVGSPFVALILESKTFVKFKNV